MKRHSFIPLFILFLLYPSVSGADYLVVLKNGSSFHVRGYWQETGLIQFNLYGGDIGIPETFVRGIKEMGDRPEEPDFMENPLPEKTQTGHGPAPAGPEGGKQSVKKTAGVKEEAPRKDKVDRSYYQDRKSALLKNHETVQKSFQQAVANNDRAAMRSLSNQLQLLNRQIAELAGEIKGKNDGILPKWWQQVK
ncbi:MAG: hypothetical protein Q8P24_07910 [Desulfobacterales bacterium]|nr:hypothetical protein [Desulfobacterales bacterium]